MYRGGLRRHTECGVSKSGADDGATAAARHGRNRGKDSLQRINAPTKMPYPKAITIEPEFIVRATTGRSC